MLDGDQVGLVGHDLGQVLVGAGDLVDQGRRVLGQPGAPLHRGFEVGGREALAAWDRDIA